MGGSRPCTRGELEIHLTFDEWSADSLDEFAAERGIKVSRIELDHGRYRLQPMLTVTLRGSLEDARARVVALRTDLRSLRGCTPRRYRVAVTVYLVRHGRPFVDRAVPASQWTLDPVHEASVTALRSSAPWPDDAAWFTSPEPKAARTAFLLTGRDVPVVDDLREQERGPGWRDDFEDLMREAFTNPFSVVHDGWEPLVRTRSRVVDAVRQLVADHPGRDLVLVGHGTAWTVLATELTGADPDVERWASLSMPDVIVIEKTTLLKPVAGADASTWHAHLWDRLAIDADTDYPWAAPIIEPLRADPVLGALFPALSHGVLHLRDEPPRGGERAQLVAMMQSRSPGEFSALAPVPGEAFGAWGEILPWPTYPSAQAALVALAENVATRDTRKPLVHEWALHDGSTCVARLVVAEVDFPGLLGRIVPVEPDHPMFEAVRAAARQPLVRPHLSDIRETWNQVDPAALEGLELRNQAGEVHDDFSVRVVGDDVWWALRQWTV